MPRAGALAVLLCLVGLLSRALPAQAAPDGVPPTPTEWVTDRAGALDEATRAALDERLSRYAASSGHQVIVWLGDTTGGAPLEAFTEAAFAKWRVGRQGLDDGIVMFLFIEDRKARIEVGYGLEDKVPDAVAIRIIREAMVPRLRRGDTGGAVGAGVDAIVGAIEGHAPPESGPGAGPAWPSLSWPEILLIVSGAIVLLVFIVTHPTLATFLLMSLLSGGRRDRRGSGGRSGGGFRGGGGRSGGGGASGSW